VSKIVPTADRAKATVMVKVAFRSYDSRVLPEMSAKVLFLTKALSSSETSSKPILTVSSKSVVARNGESMAFIVVDNKAVGVPVSVGRTMGASVEILQGLSAGDKVIATITDEIRDGTSVKIK
jgi:hypothetical protein